MFSLLGSRDRASASNISLPGLYLIVQSNGCSRSSILESLGGAAIKFFNAIISRGLWSLSMMNSLPSR